MGPAPKKLKILYTIPNFDTAGSGKALLKIAERLDREKFEPHICCMHDRGEFFEVVKKSGIPFHIFEYTADMSNRLKGLQKVWKISRFFKSLNPHLIHSFHYAPDYSEPLAAKIAGIKWVFTKKNMNWGGASKNGWKLRSWLADGIIAQNTDMLKQFFPNWKKVVLIPRGVDTVEFKPADENLKKTIREKYGFSPDEKIILTVANLTPVKGIEILIKALPCIKSHISNVKLLIVGDNRSDYATQLNELCKQLSLADNVIFLGKVTTEISTIFQLADVFVLTSLKESSPVALLEALASGIPVLSSQTSGAVQIMGDFKEQLFPVGDVEELVKIVIWILSLDQEKIHEIIAIQRRHVLENFTINHEVEKHIRFYKLLFS